MSAKTNPQKPTWEWESFTAEQYQAETANYVHYSFKTINSNATPGGIRLTTAAALPVPYVGLRTLIAHQPIALDYPKNSGKSAKIYKQINALTTKSDSDATNDDSTATPMPPTHLEAEVIHQAIQRAHTTAAHIDCDQVSMRLRQLLLPTTNGGYLAVTPLTAAGVCQVIQEAADHHNSQVKSARAAAQSESTAANRFLRYATLGVGGANPQNVGALVRWMQRPLYFGVPITDADISHVFKIYHHGMPLKPSLTLMRQYWKWRQAMKETHQGSMPTNQKTRDQEQHYVTILVKKLQAQAHSHYQLLTLHREKLPNSGQPLVSERVDSVARGLIASELRGSNWRYDCAQQFAKAIAEFKLYENGQSVDFGFFEQQSRNVFIDWIAEALQ
jgi:hypothetical protein